MPPSALAQRIIEMLRRRRPDLHELLEELSRSRQGMNLVAEAFSVAYEHYLKTAQIEDAYEAFVEVIESSISDYVDD
ncbi:MAG: hypothetical protein ACP5FT_04300 [Acidilobus sp.]